MTRERRRHTRYRRKKRRTSFRFPRGLPVLLVSVLFISGTLMYLSTRTNTEVNAFTLGKNSLEIVEDGVDPRAVAWGTNTKPVALRNPGEADNAPGVVRVMMVPYLTNTVSRMRVGRDLGELREPVGTTMVMGDMTFHFATNWSEKWFYKDGFFYYKTVLAPGETTSNILTGVTLAPGKEAEYENLEVRVDVVADILQTHGNVPSTEWGITVSGNNVSP